MPSSVIVHPLASRQLARVVSFTGSPHVGVPERASDGARFPLNVSRLPVRSVVQPSSASPFNVASYVSLSGRLSHCGGIENLTFPPVNSTTEMGRALPPLPTNCPTR